MSRVGRVLVVMVVLVSGVFPGAVSVGAASPPGGAVLDEPGPWIGAEAEQIDLDAYAEFNDVDLATAASEVADLPKLRELQSALENTYPDTYAGLWIGNRPYSVTIAATDAKDRSAIAELAAGLKLNRQPSVVAATYSLKDLRVSAAAIEKLGLEVDLDTDYESNRVIVRALNEANLKSAVLSVADPILTEFEQVSSLAQPSTSIYGGMGGDAIGWSGCPSGFSVRRYVANVGWEYGIVTAGHCGNALSYQGNGLPYVKQCFAGNCDSQYHTDGVYTAQPRFYWTNGQPPRSATATRSWSALVVGETVCHYGPATGYGCGRLAGKEFSVSYVPNSGSVYVYIDPDCQRDLSSVGDSGGPLFYGNTAYGIMSGHFEELACTDKSWAIMDSIEYAVGGVGVAVYLQ